MIYDVDLSNSRKSSFTNPAIAGENDRDAAAMHGERKRNVAPTFALVKEEDQTGIVNSLELKPRREVKVRCKSRYLVEQISRYGLSRDWINSSRGRTEDETRGERSRRIGEQNVI